MNEAEAKSIWIMLNEAGGRRSQPCFHYAEREDFGGCEADSTITEAELPSEKRKVKSEK